jgi:hypothetical protein
VLALPERHLAVRVIPADGDRRAVTEEEVAKRCDKEDLLLIPTGHGYYIVPCGEAQFVATLREADVYMDGYIDGRIACAHELGAV